MTSSAKHATPEHAADDDAAHDSEDSPRHARDHQGAHYASSEPITAQSGGASRQGSRQDPSYLYFAAGLAGLALVLAIVGAVAMHVGQSSDAGATSSAGNAVTTSSRRSGGQVTTTIGNAGSDTSLATLASEYSGSTLAADRSQAVRDAIEPLVEPYGTAVSVTYIPVGYGSAALSINGDEQHMAASMIKIVILACLLDESQQGVIDLQSTLEVTEDDIVGGSGVLKDGGVGNEYTLEDLARYMIDESDNVATNKLIDLLGKDAINDEAAKLGLTQTVLRNRLMTDDPTDGGYNVTSSNDLATVLELIATGQLVDEQTSQLAAEILGDQTLDMGLDSGTPANVLVAHKTGTLDDVAHDGGIVYADHPYVLVIMTEGVGNDEATSLIQQIAQAAYAANDAGDASDVNGADDAQA